MDKIKTVKIKNPDGSVSEESYTISVDAKNVDMENGKDLQDIIGTIDIDTDGNISEQLKHKIDVMYIEDNLTSTETDKALSANQGRILKNSIDALNIDIKKKAYFFNTVADMKAADLKVGDYVCTLGYYSINDGGAKIYYVTNEENQNIIQERLNNNLYASTVKQKSSRKLGQPIYGYLWLPGIPVNDQKINIRNYKINGFDGVIFCLHIDYSNGNFVLRENLNDIKELSRFCLAEHMEINSYKFHYVPQETITSSLLNKYYLKVMEIMTELNEYSRNIYIFNEANYIDGFEQDVNNIIDDLKTSGYSVGISFNIGSLRITKTSTLNRLDFVGYNYYPRLTSQGKYTSKDLIQFMCDNNGELNMIYYLISLFGKDKVNITETGIRDYYVYLREPSNYLHDETSEHNNTEVVKLYYNIVLETLNNNVNSIATWFTTLYSNTYNFWTEWTGGIK